MPERLERRSDFIREAGHGHVAGHEPGDDHGDGPRHVDLERDAVTERHPTQGGQELIGVVLRAHQHEMNRQADRKSETDTAQDLPKEEGEGRPFLR